MKAAGALLVILSCSVFGLSMAHSLRKRAEFLHSLVGLLTVMRNVRSLKEAKDTWAD